MMIAMNRLKQMCRGDKQIASFLISFLVSFRSRSLYKMQIEIC